MTTFSCPNTCWISTGVWDSSWRKQHLEFYCRGVRSFLVGSVQTPAALNFDVEKRIIAPKIDLYRLQYFPHHIMLLPTVSFYSLRQMT